MKQMGDMFEKIILGNPAKMHHLINFIYDKERFEFTITVESLATEETKIFKFNNISEYKFELCTDDFQMPSTMNPFPIIGIDNHSLNDNSWLVVINANDIEFSFKTDKIPEQIKAK